MQVKDHLLLTGSFAICPFKWQRYLQTVSSALGFGLQISQKNRTSRPFENNKKKNRMTPLINFSSDILNFSASLGYLKRLSEKLREVFIFYVLLYTFKVLLHLHTQKFILISLHAYVLGQKETTAPTAEVDCFICTSVFLRGLLSFRSHQN